MLAACVHVLFFVAGVFYRTRPSNWSFNVQAHRWARNVTGLSNDAVVYDIFETPECGERCMAGSRG